MTRGDEDIVEEINEERDNLVSKEINQKEYDQQLRQYTRRQEEILRLKIDKQFETPLLVSVCMLAMAHGSNEINVSAPLSAMIFLLNPDQENISTGQ